MKVSTFLFYVLPMFLLPAVTGWLMYQKGGMELMAAHWQMKALAYAIVCVVAYCFYRLDKLITQPKQNNGGIRRT